MTKQLYYEDAYLKDFDAYVIDCREGADGMHLYLDKSAFFPEGGGQDGDRGYLFSDLFSGGKAAVTDTQSDGEDIYVVCGLKAKVPAGTRVHGVLDWKFRFDRMQNHSGEHIVSGLIHRRFCYENVGFHMSGDRMTIDLSGEIGEEELQEIEQRANEIVWNNVPLHTDVYTEQEAEGVQFRSKKELHGMIRVVTIPGADVCACCGTHVRYTGEIGPIRLIAHERFRGGIRIEMMCGQWAYNYMSGILRQNREVSALTSSKPLETAAGVGKLLESEKELKGQLLELRYAEMDRMAQALADKGPVLIFAQTYDPVMVQKLTSKVMEKNGGAACVLSGSDETGYFYTIGQKDGDLRSLVHEMNQALGGKGGGRPYFLQGSVKAGKEQVETFLKEKIPGLLVQQIQPLS